MSVKRLKSDEEFEESIVKLQIMCDRVVNGIEEKGREVKRCRLAEEARLQKEEERLEEKEALKEVMKAKLSMFLCDEERCLTLDVGGEQFVTTKDTLLAVPDTLFTALLSGNFLIDKTLEGSIKLDRDPTHFSYILNYLRGTRENPTADPPLFSLKGLPISAAHHLAQEAEFYGLSSLQKMALNFTSFIVSKEVDSPYNSVNEALAKASDGDRIVMYPGTYFESIVVNKRVEICGEGPKDKIIIVTTDGSPTATFSGACKGRLVNLSLREMSRFGVCTVDIKDNSDVMLEQCDLSTRQEANTINVSDKAKLMLTECRIHGAKGSAVLLRDEAKAVIKGNELVNIGCCALQVRHKATYEVTGNVIQHAAYGGVDANDSAQGTITNNSISFCKRGAIVLHGSSTTHIHGNVITKNEYGIRSFPDGTILSFKDNRVYDNTHDYQGVRAELTDSAA